MRTLPKLAGLLLTGLLLAMWMGTAALAQSGDAAAAEEALGLTGDERRRVQQGLAAAGFAPGPADGTFGPRTRAAIKGWQGERGNEATGYLDEAQAQALLADEDEAGESVTVTKKEPVIEPKCPGVEDGWCWLELTNKPGCYIRHSAPVDHGHELLSGECTNGKAHGQAIDRQTDGVVGEGPYVDGKSHGRWTISYPDGDVHEGSYVDGKRHGEWTKRWADGAVSKGSYVLGEMRGRWTISYPDGDVHEGPYVDGKRHGHWVQRWADGGGAEGPYVDGKPHGEWTKRWADGRGAEGPYVDGKMEGKWFIRQPDGTRASGYYDKDKKRGWWTYRWHGGGCDKLYFSGGEESRRTEC